MSLSVGIGVVPPTTPGGIILPPSVRAPGAPSNVLAVAGVGGEAAVSWAAPDDPGSSPIVFYLVTAHSGGVAGVPVQVIGGTSTTMVGLTAGSSYTFTVTAMSQVGQSPPSAPSNTITLVAFVGVTTATTGTRGSSTLTITLPTGIQAGDLILIFAAHSTGDAYLIPPGYAQIVGSPIGDILDSDVFWKRATDSSDSGATVTLVVPPTPGPTGVALPGTGTGTGSPPPPPPPPPNPGAGNRAKIANGGHVDNNTYPTPRNSVAAAFAAGQNFTGVPYPWGMIEATGDTSVEQGILADLSSDPDGNFRDGRLVPRWNFSMYGTLTNPSISTAGIAAGQADGHYLNLCTQINKIAWPQISIRFGWEVDGGWFSWASSPTDYIAAFRHVHDLMTAHLTVPVLWEWNAFALRGSPNAANAFGFKTMQYYPGDDKVDVFGCDSYCINTDPTDLGALPTMQQCASAAAAHNKPCGFSEFGIWDRQGGSAASINSSGRGARAMTAYMNFFDSLPAFGQPGYLLYHNYFDGNPGTGDFSWQFFGPAKAVYQARMAQP